MKMAIKYGIIDKSGKVVIEPQFDEVVAFRDGYSLKIAFIEGLGKVKKDNKWGI
jgi:hypothetical protein